MRIAQTNSLSISANSAFKARIIDGHAHLGKLGNKNYNINNLDKFMKAPIDINVNGKASTDNIEKMVVSSAFALSDNGKYANELQGNIQMLEMIKGKIAYIPIAVCQPAITGGDTSNIKELFKKYPETFAGLKFHPTMIPLENDADFMKAYEPYIEFAKEKKLPCFFHCQGGQADAYKIYELAQKAPEVPVILGHSGALSVEGRVNRENAIKVFEDSLKTKKANIYMDLSWVDWNDQGFPAKNQPDVKRILNIAKENKAVDKVIFGTDAPLGCFGEWESPHFNNRTCYSNTVSYIKESINSVFGSEGEAAAEKIFYENSNNLYSKKANSLYKKAAIAAGITVAALAAYGIFKGRKSDEKSTVKQKIQAGLHKN